MKVLVVIPCRFDSSRFPGKAVARLAGKPLVQWVVERARGAAQVAKVVVATDDERIRSAVAAFGAEVVDTGSARTGSDRLAQVAERIEADYYLNLQGDEIIEGPGMLDHLIEAFEQSQPVEIGTLKRPIRTREDLLDPNLVKVVSDRFDDALYFSRAPIPFRRDDEAMPKGAGIHFMHLGIYIFRRDALKEFANLPTGRLETLEKLEQLRALEHGFRIKVWETRFESIRIDTPADLARAEGLLTRGLPRATA